MPTLKGAYSCVVMTATKLIAFRDPNGFRPLCLGKTEGGAWIVSSESCALDTLGAEFVRDIRPGEIVVISQLILIAPKKAIFAYLNTFTLHVLIRLLKARLFSTQE